MTAMTAVRPGHRWTRRRTLRVCALGFAVIVGVLVVWLLPGRMVGPRIIGRTLTPDGVEMCIVQQTSFKEFPWFKTSFVVRQPGADWRRFYVHHEDHFWVASRVSLDTNAHIATFNRGGSPAIAFAWATGAYTNLYRYRADAPSWQMPPGWSPEMPIP